MQTSNFTIMITDKIRFEHFFSKNSLVPLQREFIQYDCQTNPASRPITTFEENLVIDVQQQFFYEDDPEISSQIIVQRNFEKDFIVPSIATMSDLYFDFIQCNAESKGVFLEEHRRYYVQPYIIKTRSYREKISQSNVSNDILALVQQQIDLLEESMESFIENPYSKIKKKIQFNWIRTDVEVFFHLLRANKKIAHIEDADLGRIIDYMCECIPDEKANKYVSISNSRKHLNAFKNTENRPDGDAIERLKKVFKPDFFNA